MEEFDTFSFNSHEQISKTTHNTTEGEMPYFEKKECFQKCTIKQAISQNKQVMVKTEQERRKHWDKKKIQVAILRSTKLSLKVHRLRKI